MPAMHHGYRSRRERKPNVNELRVWLIVRRAQVAQARFRDEHEATRWGRTWLCAARY
jgi:hypothetical protein